MIPQSRLPIDLTCPEPDTHRLLAWATEVGATLEQTINEAYELLLQVTPSPAQSQELLRLREKRLYADLGNAETVDSEESRVGFGSACAEADAGLPCGSGRTLGVCRWSSAKLLCDYANPMEVERAFARANAGSVQQQFGMALGALGLALAAVVLCARYAPGARWRWARIRAVRVAAFAGFVFSVVLALTSSPKRVAAPASLLIFPGVAETEAMEACDWDARKWRASDDEVQRGPEYWVPRPSEVLYLVADPPQPFVTNGTAALFIRLAIQRGDRLGQWGAALEAENLRVIWFEARCLSHPTIIGDRLIAFAGNDLLAFDGDRTFLAGWYLHSEFVNRTAANADRLHFTVDVPSEGQSRHVWFDPISGATEERTLPLHAKEPDEAMPDLLTAEVLPDGTALVEVGGRAVGLRDGRAMWDRSGVSWFVAHDQLYEMSEDPPYAAVLSRVDPATGETVAEFDGEALRAQVAAMELQP